MRNILLAILVSSSALLAGCTDDLATEIAPEGAERVAAPLDETGAAARPELAAQAENNIHTEGTRERALVDGTNTNIIPCPTPEQRVPPLGEQPEEAVLADEGSGFCAELPAEGPCSLACDPDALVDRFVPKGTCVTYRCELTSGEVFQTGGCNP